MRVVNTFSLWARLGVGGGGGLNTMQITVAAPASGAYRIRVDGSDVPQGPQSFAMVVTGLYTFAANCSLLYTCPRNCSGHGACVSGRCVCALAYTGLDCSIVNVALECGRPYSMIVSAGGWSYYLLNVDSRNTVWQLSLISTVSGADPDFYIAYNRTPSPADNDMFDSSASGSANFNCSNACVGQTSPQVAGIWVLEVVSDWLNQSNVVATLSCASVCAQGLFLRDGKCVACNSTTCPAGMYRSNCTARNDAICVPCTNAPASSVYVSGGFPYNSNNCAWSCNAGFFRRNGTCVACSVLPCPTGQFRGLCTPTADGQCESCSNKPNNSYYIFAAAQSNSSCAWACVNSFFKNGDLCLACNMTACPVGMFRSNCTQLSNGPCIPCSNKPAGSSYTANQSVPSGCGWACDVGFVQQGQTCISCNSFSCPIGQYLNVCSSEMVCSPCSGKPLQAFYTASGKLYNESSCPWSCSARYFQQDLGCFPCNASRCSVGQFLIACTSETAVECASCMNKPEKASYVPPSNQNNCSWECNSGYFQNVNLCSACNISSCPLGQYRSACPAYSDSVCVQCTNKPDMALYIYSGYPFYNNNCSWICNAGYYLAIDVCHSCSTGACPLGQFRTQCTPAFDALCTPCTNKPNGSAYAPVNQSECAWICNAGYFQMSGRCFLCNTSSCAVGQYRGLCTPFSDGACISCSNKPAGAYYTAEGRPLSANNCSWSCSEGFFQAASSCIACNSSLCPIGQYRSTCTMFSDGSCIECHKKPNNSDYIEGGSCSWVCQTGYFQENASCFSCSADQCPLGKYRQGCTSTANGICISCSNKPSFAVYTSNGNPYYMNNCSWDCNSGFFARNGSCLPCNVSYCAVGFYRGLCTHISDSVCMPCTVKPFEATFVSSGVPSDQNNCKWSCDPGFYQIEQLCTKCNFSFCPLGQYRAPCTETMDSTCEPCTNKPADAVYTVSSIPLYQNNCSWTCLPGFFQNLQTCNVCNSSLCSVGQYRGSCLQNTDAPCISCSNKPVNAFYVPYENSVNETVCKWACSSGFYEFAGTCVQCSALVCPVGQYRSNCSSVENSVCRNCSNKPSNATYIKANSSYSNGAICVWTCDSGLYENKGSCAPCNFSICPAGQYRTKCTPGADGTCVTCSVKPLYSFFTSAGYPFDQDNCAWSCQPGYFQSDSSCVGCSTSLCPLGQYRTSCSSTADGACVTCTVKPLNSAFTSSGVPYDENNCAWACQPGYYQSGPTCSACSTSVCPVGQYRALCTSTTDSVCVNCTARPSFSLYTSSGSPYNQDNCTWRCLPSYYQIAMSCTLCSTSFCPIGQYRTACNLTSDSICVSCSNLPLFAKFTSAGAPYNQNNCEWSCVGGYFQNEATCTPCSTSVCSVGQYRHPCNSSVDGICVPCTDQPQNSLFSSPGVPFDQNNCNWTCVTGYFQSGQRCRACNTSACPVGQYRTLCSEKADGVCTSCSLKPSYSFFTTHGVPYNEDNCLWSCQHGYFQIGSLCSACNMSICTLGYYRTGCNATTNGVCIPCNNSPPFSYFVSPGIPYNNNNCSWSCIQGYFKRGVFCSVCNTSICGIGQYRTACSPVADGVCVACTMKPPYSVYTSPGLPESQNNCTWSCQQGYYQIGATCSPCNSSLCGIGQYRTKCSAFADGVCVPCSDLPSEAFFTSPGSPLDQDNCAWSCQPGYFQSDSSCVGCSTSLCPLGQYRTSCSSTADGACVTCTVKPLNSAFTSSGVPYDENNCAWACQPGYYQSGPTCSACSTSVCPVGQYRAPCTLTTNGSCITCSFLPPYAIFTSGGQPYNQDNCAWSCQEGYFMSGMACSACNGSLCPIGYYRSKCTSTTDGICIGCTILPPNSQFTSCGVPYDENNCEWSCQQGFFRNGILCVGCTTSLCTVGEYRASCTSNTDGMCVTCSNSPKNSFFTSPGVPYNHNNCSWSCQLGFYQQGANCEQCNTSLCTIGYYRSRCLPYSDSQCIACSSKPENSYYSLPAINTGPNNCTWTCNPGYYQQNAVCFPCNRSSCAVGEYRAACSGRSDGSCEPCSNKPENSFYTTSAATYNKSDCVWSCNTGYFADGTVCFACDATPCPVGKYKTNCTPISNSKCLPCMNAVPNASYTTNFSQSPCSWACNLGYFAMEGHCLPCIAKICPSGQYLEDCTQFSDGLCKNCTGRPFAASYVQDSNINICKWQCDPGYYQNGQECVLCNTSECEAGKYRGNCTLRADAKCIECTNKPEAATYILGDFCPWLCNVGFVMINRSFCVPNHVSSMSLIQETSIFPIQTSSIFSALGASDKTYHNSSYSGKLRMVTSQHITALKTDESFPAQTNASSSLEPPSDFVGQGSRVTTSAEQSTSSVAAVTSQEISRTNLSSEISIESGKSASGIEVTIANTHTVTSPDLYLWTSTTTVFGIKEVGGERAQTTNKTLALSKTELFEWDYLGTSPNLDGASFTEPPLVVPSLFQGTASVAATAAADEKQTSPPIINHSMPLYTTDLNNSHTNISNASVDTVQYSTFPHSTPVLAAFPDSMTSLAPNYSKSTPETTEISTMPPNQKKIDGFQSTFYLSTSTTAISPVKGFSASATNLLLPTALVRTEASPSTAISPVKGLSVSATNLLLPAALVTTEASPATQTFLLTIGMPMTPAAVLAAEVRLVAAVSEAVNCSQDSVVILAIRDDATTYDNSSRRKQSFPIVDVDTAITQPKGTLGRLGMLSLNGEFTPERLVEALNSQGLPDPVFLLFRANSSAPLTELPIPVKISAKQNSSIISASEPNVLGAAVGGAAASMLLLVIVVVNVVRQRNARQKRNPSTPLMVKTHPALLNSTVEEPTPKTLSETSSGPSELQLTNSGPRTILLLSSDGGMVSDLCFCPSSNQSPRNRRWRPRLYNLSPEFPTSIPATPDIFIPSEKIWRRTKRVKRSSRARSKGEASAITGNGIESTNQRPEGQTQGEIPAAIVTDLIYVEAQAAPRAEARFANYLAGLPEQEKITLTRHSKQTRWSSVAERSATLLNPLLQEISKRNDSPASKALDAQVTPADQLSREAQIVGDQDQKSHSKAADHEVGFQEECILQNNLFEEPALVDSAKAEILAVRDALQHFHPNRSRWVNAAARSSRKKNVPLDISTALGTKPNKTQGQEHPEVKNSSKFPLLILGLSSTASSNMQTKAAESDEMNRVAETVEEEETVSGKGNARIFRPEKRRSTEVDLNKKQESFSIAAARAASLPENTELSKRNDCQSPASKGLDAQVTPADHLPREAQLVGGQDRTRHLNAAEQEICFEELNSIPDINNITPVLSSKKLIECSDEAKEAEKAFSTVEIYLKSIDSSEDLSSSHFGRQYTSKIFETEQLYGSPSALEDCNASYSGKNHPFVALTGKCTAHLDLNTGTEGQFASEALQLLGPLPYRSLNPVGESVCNALAPAKLNDFQNLERHTESLKEKHLATTSRIRASHNSRRNSHIQELKTDNLIAADCKLTEGFLANILTSSEGRVNSEQKEISDQPPSEQRECPNKSRQDDVKTQFQSARAFPSTSVAVPTINLWSLDSLQRQNSKSCLGAHDSFEDVAQESDHLRFSHEIFTPSSAEDLPEPNQTQKQDSKMGTFTSIADSCISRILVDKLIFTIPSNAELLDDTGKSGHRPSNDQRVEDVNTELKSPKIFPHSVPSSQNQRENYNSVTIPVSDNTITTALCSLTKNLIVPPGAGRPTVFGKNSGPNSGQTLDLSISRNGLEAKSIPALLVVTAESLCDSEVNVQGPIKKDNVDVSIQPELELHDSFFNFQSTTKLGSVTTLLGTEASASEECHISHNLFVLEDLKENSHLQVHSTHTFAAVQGHYSKLSDEKVDVPAGTIAVPFMKTDLYHDRQADTVPLQSSQASMLLNCTPAFLPNASIAETDIRPSPEMSMAAAPWVPEIEVHNLLKSKVALSTTGVIPKKLPCKKVTAAGPSWVPENDALGDYCGSPEKAGATFWAADFSGPEDQVEIENRKLGEMKSSDWWLDTAEQLVYGVLPEQKNSVRSTKCDEDSPQSKTSKRKQRLGTVSESTKESEVESLHFTGAGGRSSIGNSVILAPTSRAPLSKERTLSAMSKQAGIEDIPSSAHQPQSISKNRLSVEDMPSSAHQPQSASNNLFSVVPGCLGEQRDINFHLCPVQKPSQLLVQRPPRPSPRPHGCAQVPHAKRVMDIPGSGLVPAKTKPSQIAHETQRERQLSTECESSMSKDSANSGSGWPVATAKMKLNSPKLERDPDAPGIALQVHAQGSVPDKAWWDYPAHSSPSN